MTGKQFHVFSRAPELCEISCICNYTIFIYRSPLIACNILNINRLALTPINRSLWNFMRYNIPLTGFTLYPVFLVFTLVLRNYKTLPRAKKLYCLLCDLFFNIELFCVLCFLGDIELSFIQHLFNCYLDIKVVCAPLLYWDYTISVVQLFLHNYCC